jgi:outer membrane protein OmpA-like peptidoglycan-associated protein
LNKIVSLLKHLPKIAPFALIVLAVRGQSHDPKSPISLGPGVNKGNVDNVTGPVYYSFQGGPGRVTMNFAFKSLGVFGNPLKESLNFDIYENGKFLSHSVIVSTDKLERIAPTGDLDSAREFTIYVIPQQGTIRLGGYYEIEITGAVRFGTAKGAGDGVRPVDSRLVQQTGVALTNGPIALTNGPVALTNGQVSLYEPGIALYRPGQPLTVQESPQQLRLFLAADVLFDFDRSTIRPDAAKTLQQVATIIRAKSKGVVRVEGYTDSKGNAAYNAGLSLKRAVSVKEWLASKEALNVTMTTQGFGAADPVVPNTKPDGTDDPVGRQRNRRVEIVISK